MTNKRHYMYVLECRDGSYYTGYTTDMVRRVHEHNTGKGAKYTKAKRPVTLKYWETFESKREAMRAEYYFKKQSRKRKIDQMSGGVNGEESKKL
ncbi:endonuclease [Bacillus coahuilensis p1.1.43]|uniref:Endonuclease n=1 Tax=Bacillus coahuilensis p1.1.43 TaxID=1150625 RepID=A0A147K4Z0_9BACI|nr:GIY-YIG nuclease family protein [Bacillus coahuilensis]KUP04573.1 endonuclease [Bacillus coahuilensis p1.1.43]